MRPIYPGCRNSKLRMCLVEIEMVQVNWKMTVRHLNWLQESSMTLSQLWGLQKCSVTTSQSWRGHENDLQLHTARLITLVNELLPPRRDCHSTDRHARRSNVDLIHRLQIFRCSRSLGCKTSSTFSDVWYCSQVHIFLPWLNPLESRGNYIIASGRRTTYLSYHDIVAARSAVGRSPSPVRWPGMRCSETRRSVPTISGRR